MKLVENKCFDEERAFYESEDVIIKNCTFDGPTDGESAVKECRNIMIDHCWWNLRYPFWHDDGLTIHKTVLTENCRAALWYSDHIKINDSKLHGIKALRECSNVEIDRCSILSSEFGWSTNHIKMQDTSAISEYYMMRSNNLHFLRCQLKGKYSFQYIENAVFEHCDFDTKDAFWHGKNIIVRDSVIKGEYLAWYSENVTFERCRISGTQPFCYCKGLKLIDCDLIDADLCFEKSEVEATITTPVLSIKNPLSGTIYVPHVNEIIMGSEKYQGKVIVQMNETEK